MTANTCSNPRARGTHVYWRFDADPKGFFGIVPATLLRKVLVTQVEKTW